MLEVFSPNKCLGRILRIYWPHKTSNKELHERTGMQPISLEVKRRIWRWIGHICRMQLTSIPRAAMRWTPGGKRARGRSKQTWRISVEREIKTLGWSSWPSGEVGSGQKTLALFGCGLVMLMVIQHEED